MPREDFAILTGVWHYAQSAIFRDLQSPPNDVEAVAGWLVNYAGVPNDEQHLIKVLTPEKWPPAHMNWVSAPPTQERWAEAFELLTEEPDSNYRKRPDSRLYLYFSGHGFANFGEENANLLTANAGAMRNSCVPGTYYASLVKKQALFGEVVLIMDSCRGVVPNATLETPSWNQLANFEASNKVKVCRLLAAPYAEAVPELPFDDGHGGQKVHGAATYAFLRALAEAPVDANGLISGTAIENYMNRIWPDLADEPLPKFKIDGDKETMFFAPRGPRAAPLRYQLTVGLQIAGPAELTIETGELVTVATCHLRPGTTDSTLETAGSTSPLDFDGKSVTVSLPPAVYSLTLREPGAAVREQALTLRGDRNVNL